MNDKVNKIYDQYLKRDFVFGDDNLNPKREISYDKKINLIEKFDEIECEVVARVEELINDNTFIDTSGPEFEKLREHGKSASLKAPQLRDILGGMFPEVLNGANPNLTNLLQSLIPLADNEDRPDVPAIADDICGTGFTYSYIAQAVEEDADEDLVTDNTTMTDMIKEALEVKKKDGGDDDGSEPGVSDEELEGYFENNGLPKRTGHTIEIKNKKGNEMEVDGCTKMNFSILKVYYIILMIISMVNMILNIVFTILELITQIIAFAGTCWNDPPAIGRIIELILNKVISLVMMLLNQLLQMLWDSMNLQCLSDSAKETLKQIRSLQTGFIGFMQGFDRNKYEFSKLLDDMKGALGSGEEKSSSSSNDSSTEDKDAATLKAEQETTETEAATDAAKALEGGNDSGSNDTQGNIEKVEPQSSNTPPEGVDTSDNDRKDEGTK